MMRDYPKGIKKLIRQYGALAYERELKRELGKLSTSFDDWKKEKISSSELSDIIYRFTTGPSKELFKKYDNSVLDMSVAHAIVSGLIKKDEVPSELLEGLRNAIQFYEEME